jgi:UDP-N-acetyl-D-glucosamine/UDP-N-acetyl-D-galactosamine dehydrogenase
VWVNYVQDTTALESASLKHTSLRFDHDKSSLSESDFYFVTVPTPIDGARRPDLRAILSAFRNRRQSAQARRYRSLRVDRVPGTIEEECLPVLEKSTRDQPKMMLSGLPKIKQCQPFRGKNTAFL